jgi:hypothetical protein
MSEALTTEPTGGNPVTEADLQKMLDDMRAEKETLAKERDTLASRASRAEQERDAERARAATAETERDANGQRYVTAEEQRYNAQRESVKNAIASQEQTAAAAEEELARQMEAGDHRAAAAAQRKLAQAESALTNLRNQDQYLETNKEILIPKAPAPPARVETRQVEPTGRYGQFIKGNIEPSEVEWLDRRPKFGEDPRYREKVFGASRLAATEHPRGTPGYFREMERILGETAEVRETPAAATPTRQQSADLAPQRRASPGGAPAGTVEMRLTADEAEVANGLYGNPDSEDYLPNQVDRFKKYWTNKQRMAERFGR